MPTLSHASLLIDTLKTSSRLNLKPTHRLALLSKLKHDLLFPGLGLLLLLARPGPVRAGNLYVPNSSFESVATQFADPRIDWWQKAPQPFSFDTNIFGAWDNLAGVFFNSPITNSDHIVNADGSQLGYLFAYPQTAIFQDYNSTDWSSGSPTHAFNVKFTPGKAYTLSVGITSSSQEPLTEGSTLLLALYYRDASSNMVTVAATTVTYQTNIFNNLTHLIDFQVNVPSVKPGDAWAGQNIGIQIQSTAAPNFVGGVWDLDKVRLTENIGVPNFSFESVATQFADPRINSWQKPAQPGTFDTNIFGTWDNLAGVFFNSSPTNSDHIVNAEGSQLAYVFAYPQMAIFQDYNSTDWSNASPTHAFNAKFTPGKSYSLTVGLTSSSQEPLTEGSALLLSLYYRDASSNMVTVASTTVTYDTNLFTNLTPLQEFKVKLPVVRAAAPWAGQNIGIQFESIVAPNLIGGVWDLDNVRLTEMMATILTPPIVNVKQVIFTLQSEPGLLFEIQANTNLTAGASGWVSIGSITNTTGSAPFVDTSTQLPQRLYRARSL